jgi:4-carboxymuconolactone decarboxylase
MAEEFGTGSSRYDNGLAILRQLAGSDRVAVLENLDGIAPDLGRYLVEFGYGDLYARPGLSLRDRQLATLAALTVLGAGPQVKFHTGGALNAGLGADEIMETIVHMVFYAGFPAALNALFAAKEVFDARGISTVASQPAARTA